MGKGVVDIVFFGAEEVLAVLENSAYTENEGTEFFGIGTIKWIGFQELGLGHGGFETG